MKFHITTGKLISHCHMNMTHKVMMKNKTKNVFMKAKGGGEKLLTFIMLDIKRIFFLLLKKWICVNWPIHCL